MGRERLFNDKEKWCSRCERWKALTLFASNRSRESGRQDYCRECHNKHKRTDAQNIPGFVYVIGNGDVGLYKIGCSVNPDGRLIHFQTGSPLKLDLIAVKAVQRMVTAESELHSRFFKEREHGEWFRLSPEVAVNALQID